MMHIAQFMPVALAFSQTAPDISGEPNLSYAYIAAHYSDGFTSGDYVVGARDDYMGVRRTDVGPDELHNGSKLHISVDASQVARAWDIILPIITQTSRIIDPEEVAKAAIEERSPELREIVIPPITCARIINPEMAPALDTPDDALRGRGKMITLLGGRQNAQTWQYIATRIELALATAKIKPGYPVRSDEKVLNSSYLHRRHDKPFGLDMAAATAEVINPHNPANPLGFPDPLASVDVSSVYQGRPGLRQPRKPKPSQDRRKTRRRDPSPLRRRALDRYNPL